MKKEAKEYAIDNYETCSYDVLPYTDDRRAREEAYLAGAEPREKQIADLEEKLANADYQLEGRDNEIRELKEYNKYLRRKRQGGIQKQYNKVAIIKQQNKQLTKAKELIELLLSDNRTMKAQFESEEQANIWFKHIHQAEQFLSEVEK